MSLEQKFKAAAKAEKLYRNGFDAYREAGFHVFKNGWKSLPFSIVPKVVDDGFIDKMTNRVALNREMLSKY